MASELDMDAMYACACCSVHSASLANEEGCSVVVIALRCLSDDYGDWPFGFTVEELSEWIKDNSVDFQGGNIHHLIEKDLKGIQRHGGVVKLHDRKVVTWASADYYSKHKEFNPLTPGEPTQCTCKLCIVAARRQCVCLRHEDHLGVAGIPIENAGEPILNCPNIGRFENEKLLAVEVSSDCLDLDWKGQRVPPLPEVQAPDHDLKQAQDPGPSQTRRRTRRSRRRN